MATWLRDDSDLTVQTGVNSTQIGTNLTITGNEIDVSSGDLLIDVVGNITLDSDGGVISLMDDGDNFALFMNGANYVSGWFQTTTHINCGDYIKVSGNAIKDNDDVSCITFDSSGNTTIANNCSGTFIGNVTGNLTGDITGDLTGDITGDLTGDVTGDLTGTILTAAQGNITSLGTLNTLTIDNVIVNGTTIGHTSDTDLISLASEALTINGSLTTTGLLTAAGGVKLTTIYDPVGNVAVLIDTLSNMIIANKLKVQGNIIESSTGADAITMSGSDVTILGDLTVSGGNITNAITFDSGITNAGTISAGTWSGTALIAAKVPAHDDLTGFVANEHIDWTGASAGTIHATNYTDTNTQLTTEQVQDIVGGMFSSNTETRIAATYEDSDGTIDLVVDDMTADTQLTTEAVQDIVGGMFTGNTETRIAATYEDSDGTIDLVVDDMTADLDVDVNVANLTARLPQITESVTIGDATDVDVTIAGDLISTGNLTVTGNNISGSGGSIITFSGDDVELADNLKLNSELATLKFGTAGNCFFQVSAGDGNAYLNLSTLTNLTNSVHNPINFSHATSGTPAVGIGTGIGFKAETADGATHSLALIQAITTNITNDQETADLSFHCTLNNSTAEKMRLTSEGNLTLAGDEITFPTDGARIYYGEHRDVWIGHVHNNGLLVAAETALTNSTNEALRIFHSTTGTPAVGIGSQITYKVETADSNFESGMELETVTTNVGDGTEAFDFVVKLMNAGATAAEKMRLTSAGVLTTTGNVNGASPTEMGYLSGVSSAIQTQLNGKQATLTFGISDGNVLTANDVVADDDFLRINGTEVEGRSASEVASDINASLPVTAVNSATANELVTIGATTTELDAESNLTFDGNHLIVGDVSSGGGTAVKIVKAFPGTTDAQADALWIDYDVSGTVGDGQSLTARGARINVHTSAPSHHANSTIETVGAEILILGNANGTSTAKGLTIDSGGADTNIGLYVDNADGGKDIQIVSSADSADYCSISTGASGATTLTTVDDGGGVGHLTFDVDGDIILDPRTGVTKFYLSGDTDDLCQLTVAANGATTLATADSDGALGHLTLDIDGGVKIDVNDNAYGSQFHFDGGITEAARFSVHHSATFLDIFENGGASTVDYFQIQVGASGLTTFTTTDDAAEGAHLNFSIDGHVNFDEVAVGFNQKTATFDNTDTYVRFDTTGNKQKLTLTDNCVDIHFRFPAVSGNFLCIILQDGTGGRTVSNWKTQDSGGAAGEGNAGNVLWAAGSQDTGTDPDNTETANKADIASFYWDADAEIAYGVYSKDF